MVRDSVVVRGTVKGSVNPFACEIWKNMNLENKF